MSQDVLLIEPPGEFRDVFVRAVSESGGRAHVRDDAMGTLASLAELTPQIVLVAEDPGPPGAGSLCRILRRRFGDVTVVRLGDPTLRDVLDPQSAVLPRALGAEQVARALLVEHTQHASIDPVPKRAWEGSVGAGELGPLLIAIAERWLTGRLVLTASSGERELCFVRGMLSFARSSTFAERLGPVAVRQSMLTHAALDRALDFARARDLRLAEALIELGTWQGHEACQALCAHLIEIVTAACNGQACHGRFVMDAPSHSVTAQPVLRLHPMTALLLAAQRLPAADLASTLEQLASTALMAASSLPRSLESWLGDLGVSDARALLAQAGSVQELRERLVVSVAANNTAPAPAADSLADAVTLALLRSGVLKPVGRPSMPPPDLRASLSSIAPASVASAIARCARLHFDDWPVSALPSVTGTHERVLAEYLHGARPPALARRIALLGPGAELDPRHASLLTHYLRIDVTRPRHWLGELDARAQASAHAQRMAAEALAQTIDALPRADDDAFASCKLSELRLRLDAVLAQLPGTGSAALPAPAAQDLVLAPAPSASLRPTKPSKAPPPVSLAPSSLSPGARPSQTLAAFPDAEKLVLHGKWHELRDLLQARDSDPTKLPAVLALVYAIALKEDTRPEASGDAAAKRPDADALGIRAMSELLGVPEDSAAALVIAKRTLRRRPLEWNQKPPTRISFLLLMIALAIGTGVGLLVNPGIIHLPFK